MEGPKTPMRAMARLISYMHSDVLLMTMARSIPMSSPPFLLLMNVVVDECC